MLCLCFFYEITFELLLWGGSVGFASDTGTTRGYPESGPLIILRRSWSYATCIVDV